MNITSWFQRIAQKYPYPNPAWSPEQSPQKFKYWGMEPSSNTNDYYNHELGKNVNLTRFDPKDVQLVIQHFTETYYPLVKSVVINSTNPCQQETHNYVNYDANEQPEIAEAYNKMEADIARTVENMLRRAEVMDESFLEQFTGFISTEVEHRFTKMAKEEMMTMPMYVRVYGTSKAFGGHEEGGWWYDNNKMVEQHQVNGRAEACKLASQTKAKISKQKYESAKKSFLDRHRRDPEAINDFPTFNEYLNDDSVRKEIDRRYADGIFYSDLMQGSGGARDLYDETSSAADGMGDLNYNTRDSEGMNYPRGWTTSAFENFFVTVEVSPEPREETKGRPHYE